MFVGSGVGMENVPTLLQLSSLDNAFQSPGGRGKTARPYRCWQSYLSMSIEPPPKPTCHYRLKMVFNHSSTVWRALTRVLDDFRPGQ